MSLAEPAVKTAADRTGKRVHVALPIRVTLWDQEKNPRLEMACTYDIHPRGARIFGLRSLQEAGEVISVERGRNKALCRVVWVGESDSELRGQYGIECIENGRTMWDAELREMEEVYDPLTLEGPGVRPSSRNAARSENRRRSLRFSAAGLADLVRGAGSICSEAALKNLSESGCLVQTRNLLPGAELKLVLNVAPYDVTFRGQVRYAVPEVGMGVEFLEVRRGDRSVLQYLLRKLAEEEPEEGKLKAKPVLTSP